MKRINKSSVLSLFCAFVMLLSLCLIPGVKSEAAAKTPAIDKSIVMFRNSYNRTIRIKNMKKGDVITKAVPKGNDYSIVSAYTSDEHYNEILVNTFNSSKSGTTKVLVNVKRGKKTYKLSMKVKVVSFASPIQSAKVGKKNVKKYISNVPYGLLKKDCSGKLSIKMKKGWKIQKIEQTVNGKTKKIKNNKKINTAKGAILITVKNAKLNQIEELKLAKPNF